MMLKALPTLLAIFFLSANWMSAQTSTNPVDIGLQQYHAYHGGDFDHINVDNGNLTLTLPLMSYPQRGSTLKLDFAIVYNGVGRNYYQFCFPAPPTNPPAPNLCEQLWGPSSLGASDMALTTSGVSASPALYDTQDVVAASKAIAEPGTTPAANFYQVSWASADGGTHPGGQTSTGQISLDGSGYQAGYTENAANQNLTDTCTWDCSLPSIVTAPVSLVGTQGGITWIEGQNGTARIDMDGNYILSSSSTSSITDTVGRVIPYPVGNNSPTSSQTAQCTGSLPISAISVWSPPGYSAPFTFCYATITLTLSGVNTSGTSVVSHPTQVMLQSVVLPNGQTWTFGYTEALTNCQGGGTTDVGDLTHITLPTGGTIDYTYACIEPLVQNGPASYVTAVTSRIVNANDGTGAHTWTYTYASSKAGNTTITDPESNDTVSAATTTSRTMTQYSGTGSGRTAIRITASTYPSAYASTSGYPMYPATETITLNGVSTQTAVQYCCDISFFKPTATGPGNAFPNSASYGKITDNKAYDYTTGSQGTLLRETADAYLFQSNTNYLNPGLFDLKSSETIYNGSGTQIGLSSFGHDETARVTSGVAGLSGAQMTSPLYSVFGHQTSKTDWLNPGSTNLKSTLTFYDTGEPYIATDPLNHSTSTYFCTGSSPTSVPCTASTYVGALPTVVSNALGQQSKFTYRTDTGQKMTATDPNTQTTTYAFSDSLNRLTSISYPDSGLTSIQYNDTGKIGITVTEKITSSVNKQTQSIVDGLGRTVQSILLSDPQGAIYDRTSYDAMGRMYQKWNPSRCNPMTATSCSSETTWGYSTVTYDAISRMVAHVDSDETSTQKWSYSGNAITSQDEVGNQWKRTTDALGRLTQVLEPNGSTKTPSMETDYTYDGLSNLLSVTQWGGASGTSGARTRSFTYDSLSRLLTATNSENGTTTFAYDAANNLHTKKDGRNITVTNTYDALNRITDKATSDNSFHYNYSYDSTSASNGTGRLTSSTNNVNGGTQYTYDPMGRVMSRGVCVPGNCGYYLGSSHVIRNYLGDVTAEELADAVYVGAAYDQADRINSSTYTLVGGSAANLFSNTTYGPVGLTADTLGNGLLEKVGYDTRTRVSSYSVGPSGSAIYSYGLAFDGVGNVKNANDSVNGNWTYTFDTLNRLSTGVSSTTGLSWSYDAFGNRKTQTVTKGSAGQSNLSFSSATNQVDGFCYDAAGNLLDESPCSGGTVHQFSYDAEGKLVSSNSGNYTYTYDAEGYRIAKSVNGVVSTVYFYDLAGRRVVDMDGSLNVQRTELYGGLRHLASVVGSNVYYNHGNWLGTESARSDSNGHTCETQSSLPFGETVQSSGTCSPTPMFFTGKERDAESGLDYFGARYMSSSMGRFMSPDWSPTPAPVPYADLSNPQRLNLYSYATNNPTTRIDADGHDDYNYNQSGQDDGDPVKRSWLHNLVFGDSYTLHADNGQSYSLDSKPTDLGDYNEYKIVGAAQTGAMMSAFVNQNASSASGMSLSQFKSASQDARDGPSQFDFKSQLDQSGNVLYALPDGSAHAADYIGNMTWGYLASAAGFGGFIGHAGAGVQSIGARDRNGFQPSWLWTMGDDPRDYKAIGQGYDWYSSTHPKPVLVDQPGYH